MKTKNTMRDVFLEKLHKCMFDDETIFFLAADFGSPKLDQVRNNFPDRFINVGIAEQNLINVATGLALEGFTVYAYAIAPFLTMRAFEQIRNNLALLSSTHQVNVNLIGVGAGVSYDVSGPTHHAIEDISIIRTLPNISVLSPSDWIMAESFVDYTIKSKKPKYIRFDGKPLENIYNNSQEFSMKEGFVELAQGDEICLISTGYMTHTALQVVTQFQSNRVKLGLIDVFLLKPVNEDALNNVLSKYKYAISVEEAFIEKGGLDNLISGILARKKSNIKLRRIGFGDKYHFDIGERQYLHEQIGISGKNIIDNVNELLGIK